MKIDVFCHVFPPRYAEALRSQAPSGFHLEGPVAAYSALSDFDARFRVMDRYGDYRQVISLSSPAVEAVAKGEKAAELARLANDELAELIEKHPDRFVGAVACIPLDDIDAAVAEADRAIGDLGFKGIQIYTPVAGRSPDHPDLLPLYERMVEHDLPIWMHPHREVATPDYAGEEMSRYAIFATFGWVYETSVAMARLAYSGLFEHLPELKVITHHAGAMVPFLANRIEMGWNERFWPEAQRPTWKHERHPIEYFRMFYNDTAIHGNTSGLMCAHDFFGTERLLFGTDTPFDFELGELSIRDTIRSVEAMSIPDSAREAIFEGNARKLLKL
ncbi:MAG: amidohydrolase [Deltaproteobacteria bacterium]|jgi:aminocarboxymuconate-semialdehyde decarboxylase|nr:amidohydrolase [Deltaproteobacteria bacterium]MBW2500609.1 amidohydrolase [Deltaproteobacteria bacterium]